jgi:3-oxoadipate enol-lactonase
MQEKMLMPEISADGCRIHVEVEGPEQAPVLMLSNSLGTNLHMWDDQVAAFTRHFRLVRYDRRGHGQSEVTKAPYSMERLGRDVLAILDGLKIAKMNWCGLSIGGMVGMWLGANAPERIDKLILSNTAAYFADPTMWDGRIKLVREKGLAAVVDGTMERWFTKQFREASPQAAERIRSMFLATDPEGYVGCGEAIRDMDHRALLAKVTAPTLVIAGRHDTGTPLEAGEFIAQHTPDAQLAVLDTAHIANVEEPKIYADTVLDFLSGR